jgi:hypothetical protein
MDNIGQLLHKLTKYQTLYGFVTNESKRLIYNQKINYYKQQLEKAGIDQNNINGVQNLVGGVAYEKDANNILLKLTQTQQSQKSSEKEQTEINQSIQKATTIIDNIEQNYTNTIDTIKYIIEKIEGKIKSGSEPAASVLPGILKEIKKLETKLTNLKKKSSDFKKNITSTTTTSKSPSKKSNAPQSAEEQGAEISGESNA